MMSALCRFASCPVGLALTLHGTLVTQPARFIPVLLLGLLLGTSDMTIAQIPAGHFTDIKPVLADPLYYDYSPTVTTDGLTMIFTNLDWTDGGFQGRPGSRGFFDLFMATRTNTEESFGNIVNLGSGVNTSGAEESSSISQDGETLYFGAYRGGDYDLYQATRDVDGSFGNVMNLGPAVNSDRYENRPCISADGLTVYYDESPDISADERLWSADRPSIDVLFGNAQDLGDNVNGPPGGGYRSSPSISSDERFLFYHTDMDDDNIDIWVSSRLTKEDQFGPRTNINDLWPGTDINTDDWWEEGTSISPDWPAFGSKLYFSSNRIDGKDADIFQATWVPEPLLGDLNLDGEVNGLDVDSFVDVLLNGPYQAEADMDQNEVVNGLDVDPFVAAVVSGGAAAVPEPSTLLLCIIAPAVAGGWRKWRG